MIINLQLGTVLQILPYREVGSQSAKNKFHGTTYIHTMNIYTSIEDSEKNNNIPNYMYIMEGGRLVLKLISE